jgi:hypothetical protein
MHTPTTTETGPTSDVLRLFLGDEYREDDPIWNFLRYKGGNHDVTMPDGAVVTEADAYVAHDEVAAVNAEGFKASGDAIYSLWDTLTQAIALSTGRTDLYYRSGAIISGRRDFDDIPPCHGADLLLKAHEAGRYADITRRFEDVARLMYSPGGVILHPIRLTKTVVGTWRGTSFNFARASLDRDYYDRSLEGVRSGRYRAFFSGTEVAPRFRLDTDETGAPTDAAFSRYISENSLEMIVNPNLSIKKSFDGDPDPRSGLPATLGQCFQWGERGPEFITERKAAVARKRNPSITSPSATSTTI